jgi:hypothetical protein
VIAIIKGDIIGSRQIQDATIWSKPLKALLSQWGTTPRQWELAWGDSFQLEVSDPMEALQKALHIKARIHSISNKPENMANLGVRMAIGIGEKNHQSDSISESSGSAFIYAAEKFEQIEAEGITLGMRSEWADLDERMNLYLKLACVFMDKWSRNSGEIMDLTFSKPDATQEQLGKVLGLRQNSVSGRWSRAHGEEVLLLERRFRIELEGIMI